MEDMHSWARLMGCDLERAAFQPLQPVRVGRDGAIRLTNPTLRILGISNEDCLRVEMQDRICVRKRVEDGGHILEKGKLPVTPDIAQALAPQEASGAVLVGGKGKVMILPLTIQEHASDDPVPILAKGDDWVAWMTRNCILGQPITGDDRLQASLAGAIYQRQRHDGSWKSTADTAYSILRLLALDEAPSDERIQRATR